ncbi:MAG: transposase [Planctomycetes bacterium]|nr:transposase [Planctomycetota bacterium]
MRLPMAVCAAVAEVVRGSHQTLDAMFEAAGAPGPPPALPHHSKWKMWLFRAGNDPSVDSFALLGNLIEEFMDLPPASGSDATGVFGVTHDELLDYPRKRDRLIGVLEEHGFRYFRGGRVLPNGNSPVNTSGEALATAQNNEPQRPSSLEELLQIIIRGLPRAMHPLTHRRKGATALSMGSEYDIQDLLHSQLRPWIADIRPEEFTPSYAGSCTRMDFLLPAHSLVIETKHVRDRGHATRIGNELILDIEHYRRHPKCDRLWCVVYDPLHLVPNPAGMIADLEGTRSLGDGSVQVRVFIISGC